MIADMVAKAGVDPGHIYKAAAVGNPVMLHFLAGIYTAGFEGAPYAGVFAGRLELEAAEMGLSTHPECCLTLLPQLGGFVGADTTACLLMLKPYHQKTFLLLDIGTNGEIVLGHEGRMWTASAAAGPAFEGGAVTCGMRAGIGAVDKMSWSDAQLHKRVIGGGMPRGICGSGIIDLVSLLLANGFIDRQGTFTAKVDDWFKSRVGQRGHEIFLAGEDEVPGNGLLVFNQEDLRQFQLARSALRTAIEIMLQEAGIDAGRLEYVFLAGAFGTYVDPDSIINIGIIPPVDVDKIKNIGNAAADGAVMALLSPRLMEEAEGLQTRVAYIELALRDEFQALFIKNLDF